VPLGLISVGVSSAAAYPWSESGCADCPATGILMLIRADIFARPVWLLASFFD